MQFLTVQEDLSVRKLSAINSNLSYLFTIQHTASTVQRAMNIIQSIQKALTKLRIFQMNIPSSMGSPQVIKTNLTLCIKLHKTQVVPQRLFLFAKSFVPSPLRNNFRMTNLQNSLQFYTNP